MDSKTLEGPKAQSARKNDVSQESQPCCEEPCFQSTKSGYSTASGVHSRSIHPSAGHARRRCSALIEEVDLVVPTGTMKHNTSAKMGQFFCGEIGTRPQETDQIVRKRY